MYHPFSACQGPACLCLWLQIHRFNVILVVIGFGQLFLLAERQPDRPRPQGYINPGRNRIIAEPVGFATGNGEGSRRRIRTLIALQNPVA